MNVTSDRYESLAAITAQIVEDGNELPLLVKDIASLIELALSSIKLPPYFHTSIQLAGKFSIRFLSNWNRWVVEYDGYSIDRINDNTTWISAALELGAHDFWDTTMNNLRHVTNQNEAVKKRLNLIKAAIAIQEAGITVKLSG